MHTRQTAITVAVVGFFVLAAVGWLRGSSVFACATRALVGAVVLFVLVRLVSRILLRIVADAIIRSAAQQGDQQEPDSEQEPQS